MLRATAAHILARDPGSFQTVHTRIFRNPPVRSFPSRQCGAALFSAFRPSAKAFYNGCLLFLLRHAGGMAHPLKLVLTAGKHQSFRALWTVLYRSTSSAFTSWRGL